MIGVAWMATCRIYSEGLILTPSPAPVLLCFSLSPGASVEASSSGLRGGEGVKVEGVVGCGMMWSRDPVTVAGNTQSAEHDRLLSYL